MNSAALKCNDCSFKRNLKEEDYIKSRWWPGLAEETKYLFSEELLIFWYHLNHENNGLSLRKFLSTLICVSKKAERVRVFSFSLNIFELLTYIVSYYRILSLIDVISTRKVENLICFVFVRINTLDWKRKQNVLPVVNTLLDALMEICN